MITCQLELKIEKNQLENPGIFKPISKNAAISQTKTKTHYGIKKDQKS